MNWTQSEALSSALERSAAASPLKAREKGSQGQRAHFYEGGSTRTLRHAGGLLLLLLPASGFSSKFKVQKICDTFNCQVGFCR